MRRAVYFNERQRNISLVFVDIASGICVFKKLCNCMRYHDVHDYWTCVALVEDYIQQMASIRWKNIRDFLHKEVEFLVTLQILDG
jgi:hypothetical protein